MKYEDSIIRGDAMDFLLKAYANFPFDIPEGPSNNVSDAQFKTWRWVRCLDGEIVFANCIQQAITKVDFDQQKMLLKLNGSLAGGNSHEG